MQQPSPYLANSAYMQPQQVQQQAYYQRPGFPMMQPTTVYTGYSGFYA